MPIDLRAFYRAVNPTTTIGLYQPENRRYYLKCAKKTVVVNM